MEETLPWPGKMASPPEPRDAGDSAPAGFGLAPFGNQRAELASPCSQMSVEGKGDDVCVAAKASGVIKRIHHDLLSPQLIISYRSLVVLFLDGSLLFH